MLDSTNLSNSQSRNSFKTRTHSHVSKPYLNVSGPGDYNIPELFGRHSVVIGSSSPSYSMPAKSKPSYHTIEH
jgi:hypothetical protein